MKHSLKTARELGYRILIFNAVVKGNDRAIQLYTKLGFQRVGVIPGGFLLKSGVYQDNLCVLSCAVNRRHFL